MAFAHAAGLGDGESAARAIEKDDADRIVSRLNNWIDDRTVDAVVITGGTGLTGRDVTPEALDRVKTRDIPGFGELFRLLSYKTIGTSTIQSRAWSAFIPPSRIATSRRAASTSFAMRLASPQT